MSSTLLEPPPSGQEVPSEPADARPSPRRVRPREERVLAWALLLSVLVHLVAFLAFRFQGPHSGAVPVRPGPLAEPEGMQVLNLVELPGDALPDAEAPDLIEDRVRPSAARSPVTVPDRVDATRDPVRGIAERMSPILGDPRLFADRDPDMPAPVNPEALARDRFLALIDAYNDSSSAAAAAAAAALDWTYTDSEGKKWGFSPGKIHLGGLTLPLPITFAPPPGRRDDLAARAQRFSEIQDQRFRESGKSSFDERVKAIRERNQAQRDSTRRSGGS